MSSFPFQLPTHAPTIRATTTPERVEMFEIWTVSALVVLSVGIVCLNVTWATSAWQTLLFAFAAGVAFQMKRAVSIKAALPMIVAGCIPLLGVAQMLLSTTAYRYATMLSTMSWAVIPAYMLLGLVLFRTRLGRDAFLRSLWVVAAAVTAVELYQIFVLGRYAVTASGLPLLSSNFYAELAELLLPAVLAMALRKGENLWLGCGLCALLAGTTVASGARMGSVLIGLEIVAVVWRTQKSEGYRKLSWKQHAAPLVGMLMFALLLEGATSLTQRLHEENPFTVRSEVVTSSIEMIKAHPFVGVGLGSFPVVYPAYSHFETSYYINHVHNDYLELLANGGVIGAGLWFLMLALTLPAALKAPWAFGVFGIMIHSFSDFPMYRLPVVALLALLLIAAKDREVYPVKQLRRRSTDTVPRHLSS